MYNTLKRNSFLLVHIPFMAYVLLLSVLLVTPSSDMPDVFNFSDKIKHFLAFMVLSFMFSMSLHFQTKFKHITNSLVVFVLIIALAYGGITELLQSYVPGRSADLIDWLMDALGVIVGLLLFLAYKNKYEPKFI